MVDPLADIVTLLQPTLEGSKMVLAAGSWRVGGRNVGHPFYALVLEGSCHVASPAFDSITLQSGDFVLVRDTVDSMVTSHAGTSDEFKQREPIALGNNEFRVGDPEGPIDTHMLVGHCSFGSHDQELLISLLPPAVRIRGEERLTTLVQLLREEARASRPAREVVLSRLLEILFVEALRSVPDASPTVGLMRGLADPRLAAALRRMHESPEHGWTVAELAREAALSRSTFFERFSRAIGVAPMQYLLDWRMALARDFLRRDRGNVAEVAARVGYGSASTFSVAFTRHVGQPPSHYARQIAGQHEEAALV